MRTDVFDGTMVVLAFITINVAHPGRLLGPMLRVIATSSSDDLEKSNAGNKEGGTAIVQELRTSDGTDS